MSTGSSPAAATAASSGRVQPLAPGDPAWLGSWQLRGRLGSGGMGTAYLGVDPGGQVGAVKQLRVELIEDPTSRARFRREVALARRVDAACVAGVLDADVDGHPPFIAFAFVDGPSLIEQVRARGALPSDQLLALALGLGDALRAIHEAGVVHRDLSGNNVLITDAGPKVIDFGIARSVEADATAVTSTQVGIGTPGWMAPEQIRGQPPTPAADVFSWGCLIAYAAGCPPFGQDRSDAVLYRTVHEPPKLPALPAPLDALVPAALEKDPQRRPTAAALTAGLHGDGRAEPVAAAVARTWRVEPVTTSELSTLHTTTAPRRRRLRPAHLLLGVIGALASIAAGAGVAILALDAVEPGAGDDAAAEAALADDDSDGEDQRQADAPSNEDPPATDASPELGAAAAESDGEQEPASAAAPTDQRIFQPWDGAEVRQDLEVVDEVTGECWAASHSVGGRPEAWRCITDNSRIMDPCFSYGAWPEVVACASVPWDGEVTIMHLHAPPEPLDRVEGSGDQSAWALQLANGQRCAYTQGVTTTLDSMRMNYACDDGLAYGENQGDDTHWSVYYQADGSSELTEVPVEVLWR